MRRIVRTSAAAGPPPGSVYVGRPTFLGNPFVIGKDGTRDEVVRLYARWFARKVRDPGFAVAVRQYCGDADLACWCAPAACQPFPVIADLIEQYL